MTLEVTADDVLHREEPGLGLPTKSVERGQVRMPQLGERAKLSLEAHDRIGVDVDLPQRLHGHELVASSIVGAKDLPHPPLSELLPDIEPRDFLEELADFH